MKASTFTSRAPAVALLALASLWLSGSQDGTKSAAPATENKYIGAEKCKSCHGAKESGDQYSAWKAMKHAKAFATLASEEAKKTAAAKGIADPQKAEACVKCHVTAFAAPESQIKKGFDRTQGVQCEACHGPGEKHMKARFAAAADAGTGPVKIPADEIVAVPDQKVCLGCHNAESPNFKPFCYHDFVSKVRHLNPKKPRAAGDLKKCGCAPCGCEKGCPEDHSCEVPADKCGERDAARLARQGAPC